MSAPSQDVATLVGFQPAPRIFVEAHPVVRTRPRTAFVMSLAAVLAFQILSGAYGVERGGYSDDAAHLLNGMVLRDYLVTAFGQNPVVFAEQYYENYPKIAPMMWPPLFHVALGLLLLPGWPAGSAALILTAVIVAWLSWRLYQMAGALCSGWATWVPILILLTTPIVVSLAGTVMLDLAIAALSIEAAHWLAEHARRGFRRDAIALGLFTAMACLTKGNGVALALAPPAFIVLSGRYDLLRRVDLYLSGLIVIVLAVPLLAISATFDAGIGDFAIPTVADVSDRLVFYSTQLWRQVGPATLIFGAVGMWSLMRRRRESTGAVPLGLALMAVLAASTAFHLLNPHKTSSTRYLAMAIAPLAALAWFGVCELASPAYPVYWRRATRRILAAAFIIGTAAVRPAARPIEPFGYRSLVSEMAVESQLAGKRVLVVSDEAGEGAFVSETALARPVPAATVVRGSKLLASDNWNGHNLRLNYASPEAIYRDLEGHHVDYVVLDRSGRSSALAYFDQVLALAASGRVKLVKVIPAVGEGGSRRLELYRVPSRAPGAPKPVRQRRP